MLQNTINPFCIGTLQTSEIKFKHKYDQAIFLSVLVCFFFIPALSEVKILVFRSLFALSGYIGSYGNVALVLKDTSLIAD